MLYDMNGNRNVEPCADEDQIIEFYMLLFEKLFNQQKEIYSALAELPTMQDICNTLLKYTMSTFGSVKETLETGTYINTILGVKEDRSELQKKLFDEANAYFKKNNE